MPRLEWVQRAGRICLRLNLGADELRILESLGTDALAERLPVYPAAITDAGTPAVPSLLQSLAGLYTVEDRASVVFAPRYPFVAGTAYTVGFRLGADAELFSIEAPRSKSKPATLVLAIFPALAEVPRNLLRFYVEFSAPMSEGMAAGRVMLVDHEAGTTLPDTLLSMDPELWDPQRRRLTVLLDPARIKRGLAPHLESGYPLLEGQRIDVVIDPSLVDAAGQPLVAEGRRTFAVGADLRGLVDPRHWAITAPAVGSTEPLRLGFDRPLDVGLLAHCLAVADPDGDEVRGAVELGTDGLSWALVPDRRWIAGRHQLVVDQILEDVAGNSVRRVFDRDLDDPGETPRPDEPAVVDVSIGPG